MELAFVDWLRRRLGDQDLPLALGDDAALLPAGAAVLTTDMLMDGVDFVLAECGPRAAGRKALAVNLSDLAAMAARPCAALVSLALPRQGAEQMARELIEGLLPLARQYGVAIAGGDTNTWDQRLAISVTAVGQPVGAPLRRNGARPGDTLLVTGQLGGSILGRHFSFEPRVEEALLLNSLYQLHAGLDISDGLSLDAWRMAQASRCGLVLEAERIPLSADAVGLADQTPRCDALQHALQDGEDFELLVAVPPSAAEQMIADQPLGVPLTAIGCVVDEPGLWLQQSGQRRPLTPQGYEHDAAP